MRLWTHSSIRGNSRRCFQFATLLGRLSFCTNRWILARILRRKCKEYTNMVLQIIVSILIHFIKDPIDKHIVKPIIRHTSYPFNCGKKFQKLQDEVERMQNKRVRLQKSVADATSIGEEIYPNVTEWLITAEKDINEAEILIQGKKKAKKKCCIGFCPNFKTRYQLSKKADKKALAIDKQLKKAEGSYPISFRPPLQQIVERSLYSREDLPSRVLMRNEIMTALKDPNLNMIGVYGMGGVGKSTLAKEVQGKAVEEKLFRTVVMVPVSQTPDLRRIQGEIAAFLNLQFKSEEILGRASELHLRLKKDKVLLILDDLWQKLDLNAVGIPESCKMLLISRKKDLLSNEMCTQKVFPLGVLEEEEAWRLFEMSVIEVKDPQLRAIATEIAKKCGGLPLLILKVAVDLRNKGSYAWSDMLNMLSFLENTDIYEKEHKVIQSSYEKLVDEEAKSFFLVCALFGESNLRIHDLLVYSMGLGLFKHLDSIERARNRVLTLIDKLKSESLLLDGDKPRFVKIHDVVRDIALAIASKVQHAFVGTSKVRLTDLCNPNSTRISLPYCDIYELPEVLECPEVELFSLFLQHPGLDIPNSFFKRVTKLKVLHFTGLRFISRFPSSLGFLTSLQTLNLHRCRLDNVAMVGELKQLQLLSFADSKIAELPREIKALTRLKLSDLSRCYDLLVIPSNVLSNLLLLEDLYMLKSFDGWDVEGNASLVELKNLSHLKTLEIQVKDEELLPDDWFFNGLPNYKISVGNWGWYSFEEYEPSRMLQLQLKESTTGFMHSIKEFLRGTKVLHLREVKGIQNLLYDSGMEHIDYGQLRILDIRQCNTLKNLFPFSTHKCLPQIQQIKAVSCSYMNAIVGEGDGVIEFTQLSSLTLQYLPRLTGFCKTSGMVSFPNLTSLEVYECNSLKYVFTTSMAKSLVLLKKLQITNCESVEEIILSDEIEAAERTNMIVFPELDFLELNNLPNLERFSGGYPVKFPKLSELKIKYCRELKNFVSRFLDRSSNNESTNDEALFNELVTFSNLEIMNFSSLNIFRYLWHRKFADDDSFSKLKSLKIKHFLKLSVVFPSNVHRRFRRFESLYLSSCDGVKEIYEYKGAGLEETNILQPFALRKVYIYNLPSLKHIFSKDMDEAFSFKNLQSIEVRSCAAMRYVFSVSIACGLLQLQHFEIGSCGVEMIIADQAKKEGSEGSTTRALEWPELKYLDVRHCDKLIKFISNISIAKHDIPTQDSLYFVEKVIPNVEVLKLDDQSLKAIQSGAFPVDHELLWKLKEVTLRSLQHESIPLLFGFLRRVYSMEKLIFEYASNLGDIFNLDEERAIGEQKQNHLRLKHLELSSIRELKHIVKKDSKLNPTFQRFQILSISQCDDMMNIAPSFASFQNLTTLDVYACNKMTSLVTASTARSMTQLVELRVYLCDKVEEIVVGDGDCTEEEHGMIIIIFKKLKHLELNHLIRLNSFCSGNYSFSFPLLERVRIERCNRMKIFCRGALSTPKLVDQIENFGNAQKWKGNEI